MCTAYILWHAATPLRAIPRFLKDNKMNEGPSCCPARRLIWACSVIGVLVHAELRVEDHLRSGESETALGRTDAWVAAEAECHENNNSNDDANYKIII